MPYSSSNVMTKSTSLRTVRREASSFLEAQGPMNTMEQSGCSALMRRAVATIGVSSLEMLPMMSGNCFLASTLQDGQQEVSRNGSLPSATVLA